MPPAPEPPPRTCTRAGLRGPGAGRGPGPPFSPGRMRPAVALAAALPPARVVPAPLLSVSALVMPPESPTSSARKDAAQRWGPGQAPRRRVRKPCTADAQARHKGASARRGTVSSSPYRGGPMPHPDNRRQLSDSHRPDRLRLGRILVEGR
ncbi:hypothetical protein B5D80_01185 [Micromonospora wenchangensis]|uniref:Uncharacterized protein n=1 Tax=Micromonospora wenchangensis TaxID=1185415 RepID=A0A246RU35_9ACTN|nr:hypothetical protein B5D80_01185 [Micromonospora wenchangensis]